MRLFWLSLGLVPVVAGCSSLHSVELFKVNDNGDVVNIGRMNDEGHMVYGQFREAEQYDLAATTTTSPAGTNDATCYIKVNKGKTSDSPGVGIRIEPCMMSFIVNEGPVVGGIDDIGFYFRPTSDAMGTYRLYHYNGKDDFDVLVERPVKASDWENAGFDALRMNDDGTVTLNYTQQMADGTSAIRTETVSVESIRDGSALAVPPVVVENPVDENIQPAAETTETAVVGE